MERQPVQSKAIAAIGYDPAHEILEIEFCSGRVYRYLGVPADVHAWLMRSPSKGGVFRRLIENEYAFERVGEEPSLDLEDALRASLTAASTDADDGTDEPSS